VKGPLAGNRKCVKPSHLKNVLSGPEKRSLWDGKRSLWDGHVKKEYITFSGQGLLPQAGFIHLSIGLQIFPPLLLHLCPLPGTTISL